MITLLEFLHNPTIVEDNNNIQRINDLQTKIAQLDATIAQRITPLNAQKLQLQKQLNQLMKQQPAQQPAPRI